MASSKVDIRSFCNSCQRSTHHASLSSHTREYREGDGAYPRVVAEAWNVLQCMGCESIKICMIETSTDFKSPRETHYPPLQSRSVPKWARQLPTAFHDLVREVYVALNAQCPCLSTMGTRALVDEMLSDLVGDVGGFAVKLAEAVKNGLLTEKQRHTIEAAVEAGHAVSHRGYRPTDQQVFDTLDIVEHALMDRYVIGDTSIRLAASVPPRAKGTS